MSSSLLPPIFPHEIAFDPQAPGSALTQLPSRPAVFALSGSTGEPYLNRTADLRRRLTKLLTPAPAQSKRLQLAGLVRRILWAETASEFSAQLLLYRASVAAFGERAEKRMHLHAPYFVRMGMRNRFPRVWVTNAIALSSAEDLFGPFPSRNAAERYAEQVLDLHLLRHCFQDLDPDPAFPGCIYSEIKKCLAPCYGGCSDERYSEEAAAVYAFLQTNGQSLLDALARERERASEALDFEGAAAVHARYEKAQSVGALTTELTRALSSQHAVLVQPGVEPDQVALYLVQGGNTTGPVAFSVLGMRLPNEQSGSSSLFAHPAALAAVPLEAAGPAGQPTPDSRLRDAMKELEAPETARQPAGKQELWAHQALLARWYFRPQAKREGEIVFAEPGAGSVALKPLMRACARVYRAHVERHAPVQTVTATTGDFENQPGSS